MSHRPSWETSTHNWDADIDLEHLAEVRARLALPYLAGCCRHLILEILAYDNGEAKSQRRTGFATVTHLPHGWVTVPDDGRGTDTRRDSEGNAIHARLSTALPMRWTAEERNVDGRSPKLRARPRKPPRKRCVVTDLSVWYSRPCIGLSHGQQELGHGSYIPHGHYRALTTD